jgi:hypothetical protein
MNKLKYLFRVTGTKKEQKERERMNEERKNCEK